MESESSAKLCNFVCKESGKKFSLTSGETNATKLGQLFRLLPASIVVVDVKSRRTFFPDDGGKLKIPYAEGEFEVEGDSLRPVPTLTRDAKSVRGEYSPGRFSPPTPTGRPFGWTSSSSSFSGCRAVKRPSTDIRPTTWKKRPSTDKTTFRRIVFQLVKFDGTIKTGGGRNFSHLDTFTLKVPVDPQITTQRLVQLVSEELRGSDIKEAIVITDGRGCRLSDSAHLDDLITPNRRFLVATARNFNKHFRGGCLKDLLSLTPEKPMAASIGRKGKGKGPLSASRSKSSPKVSLFAGASSGSESEQPSSQYALTKELRAVRDEVTEVKRTSRLLMERMDGLANTLAAVLDSISPPGELSPQLKPSSAPVSLGTRATVQDAMESNEPLPLSVSIASSDDSLPSLARNFLTCDKCTQKPQLPFIKSSSQLVPYAVITDTFFYHHLTLVYNIQAV